MTGAAIHPRNLGISTVLLRLVLFTVPLFALMVALQLATVARTLHTPILVMAAFGDSAVMIVAYRGAVRLIERRPATELALDASSASAAPAALLGIGIYALAVAVLWLAGVVAYAGLGSFGVLPVAAATALIPAFTEEIVFRGAIFRIVEEGFGTLVALILSAVLFSAIHFVHYTIVGSAISSFPAHSLASRTSRPAPYGCPSVSISALTSPAASSTYPYLAIRRIISGISAYRMPRSATTRLTVPWSKSRST